MYTQEIKEFFDRFCDDFSLFDGKVIAERYTAPFAAIDAVGKSTVHLDRPTIEQLYQNYLDGYLAQGVQTCRYQNLESMLLGKNNCCATVTWELLGSDKKVVVHWRESYLLVRDFGKWKVFATVDHDK